MNKAPEFARETLKLLTARKVPPTPDNYRKVFYKISGEREPEPPLSETFLRELARALPRDNPERLRLARAVDQAVAEGSDATRKQALFAYLEAQAQDKPLAWNDLIGRLIRQWDLRQAGWTQARKRESLERVLSSGDPNAMFERLSGLVGSWSKQPSEPGEDPDAVEGEAPAASSRSGRIEPIGSANPAPPVRSVIEQVANDRDGMVQEVSRLLQQTLRDVVPASIGDQPDLIREAIALAEGIAQATSVKTLQDHGDLLKRYAVKLEMLAGDAAEVREGLLNLLRLLLQNIDELVLDDQWLHGQVEVLRNTVDNISDIRKIDEAERRLRDVIYKQSQLKHSLTDAQQAIKTMIAGFIRQISSFSDSTGSYHEKLEGCSNRIAEARDITEITGVLDEVMRETRQIQAHAQATHQELQAARQQVLESEARIATLQQELDAASRAVTTDPLTGVFNRRGLEDMFRRESARAARGGRQLCVALLDIDNFKKLNDTLGHQTGDEALVHLATITRKNLRPQDTVARYGGEEFILLYPDTVIEDAAAALTRLQRELTREFFLANNQKVFITFSAGVARWNSGEPMEGVIKRADDAMYTAKKTGKNRVEIDPASLSPEA